MGLLCASLTGCTAESATPRGRAPETVTGKDAIINSRLNEAYSEVGILRGPDSVFCAATLIGPNQAVTSADCLRDYHDGDPNWFVRFQTSATSIEIVIDNGDGTTTPTSAATRYDIRRALFTREPDANGNLLSAAVIELDRDVDGVTPATIADRDPTAGDLAVVLGFGVTTEDQTAVSLIVNRNVGYTHLTTVDSASNWFEVQGGRPGEALVAAGDIGAPIFVRRRGHAPELVGVTLYAAEDKRWGGILLAGRVRWEPIEVPGESMDGSGEGSDTTPSDISVDTTPPEERPDVDDQPMESGADGSDSGADPVWEPSESSCVEATSCDDCASLIGCGWSVFEHACHAGHIDGSLDGVSTGDDWVWTVDVCWSRDI